MSAILSRFWTAHGQRLLVAIALLGLALGGWFHWKGDPASAGFAFALATLPVLAALIVEIVGSLLRGDVGLDIVAALSMGAGLAFGEPLAANVVALMYAGGQGLEAFAAGRARREMTALMGRVARTALRLDKDDLREIPIDEIAVGDRLLIRHGEVLPVDGVVDRDAARLDLSALTGESLPVSVEPGDECLSGSASVGPTFVLRATRPAAESTYAGIVRLVAAAEASRAPMVRLADRYAIWFLVLTLAVALFAYLISGDTRRVLAVLVVATPCPLILAVPVAWIAGMSRAAGMGVLVKGGAVLEALSRIHTVILDKTGTLTHGQADIAAIRPLDGFGEEEILLAAASLDRASGHVVAEALVRAAEGRGLALHVPEDIAEEAGTGIAGRVDGRRVRIGGLAYVLQDCLAGEDLPPAAPGSLRVAVAIDGRLAGAIELRDRIRSDAAEVLHALRLAGVREIVLASGDRAEVVEDVASTLSLDRHHAELVPGDKVQLVRAAAALGPVMMVGDGINDAPALAAADVGVAMGARGAVSSSEAAGVVLLVDRLEPLARAMLVARRSRRIALESVVAGLGLSLAGMVAAAFGYLEPVEGALLQEAIDVAVILNALRALR